MLTNAKTHEEILVKTSINPLPLLKNEKRNEKKENSSSQPCALKSPRGTANALR
jgi:hypothetical protein